MAISWDDFDKIWASTSPLTPYNFSEVNYKQGWNFVGATPPARQMWDSIQKANDEKFKFLRDNFGTPNMVTTAAQMTDTDKIYVYVGSEAGWNNGHWYYYDAGTSTWVDGGVYNSTAFVTDTTLTEAGKAADAKATGDAIALKPNVDPTLTISGAAADAKVVGYFRQDVNKKIDEITDISYGKNRFNINGETTDGYYLGSNGELIEQADWKISDYCPVEGFTNVYCWRNDTGYACKMWYACAYNSAKEFLSNLGNNSTFALPENTAYIRFCEHSFANIMLESGTTKTTFEPYTETLNVITDKTLSMANVPADAKVVGETIGTVTDELYYEPVQLTMIDSKYVSGNTGAITNASNANHKISDYIEITPNSKVMITTEHFFSQGLYAFYDENKVFISGMSSNPGSTVTELQNAIVKVPVNAKFLVIGYLYQKSFPEPFVFQGIKQQANPSVIWSAKKWTCIGDSLTAYNTRTSMHYFNYIQGATGINIVNMGVSGSGYAKGTDNFMNRVLNVPTDSDVVTIFGSGNDASSGVELGTATDTGTSTLGGIINTTIDNLYSIMPVVQLGLVTPTPWQGNMPYDNGWMERYANLIKEICYLRSIPCLDLYHCSNLDPNRSEVRSLAYAKDDGNGVHPSELGHKIIASRFLGFLHNLIL